MICYCKSCTIDEQFNVFDSLFDQGEMEEIGVRQSA